MDQFDLSSQYKEERMKAIGKEVSKGEYDLYLFQELWIEEDYNMINANKPEEFHITKFLDFNEPSSKCGIQYCIHLCKFLNTWYKIKYRFTMKMNNG